MGNIIAFGQLVFQISLARLEYLRQISICLNIMSYAMSITGFPTTPRGKDINVHIMSATVVDAEP